MAALTRIFTTDHPYFRRILTRASKAGSVKCYIGIALMICTIYNFNDLSTTSTLKSSKGSNVFKSNIDHSKATISQKKLKPTKTLDAPIDLPERFQLPDSNNNSLYFTPRENGKIGCYTDGSVHPEPGMKWPCKCRPGFYGPACSIPEVVLTSACHRDPESCLSLKVRTKPRRIIRFLNVHREIDLVEIQLGDHSDLVDVFVIGESESTISGAPNELFFLPKMKDEGLFKEYQHKIIHVVIPATDFPDDVTGKGNGYITEGFIRNYMGEKGLTRIDGIEDDDIVLLSDTNKFINRDVLMFLKIHDGFPEPVRVNFLELEYGFFWRRKTDSGSKYAHFQGAIDSVACTIGMLREVYDNHLMLLRRESFDLQGNSKEDESLRKLIAKRKLEYSRGGKHNVSDNWAIGRLDSTIGGFHCSWCYQPEGIREHWLAAKTLNLPDWGPSKEKLDLEYIEEAIAKGNLFGLSERNVYLENPEFEGDLNFAPDYVWKNQNKFGYLLYPDDAILESI